MTKATDTLNMPADLCASDYRLVARRASTVHQYEAVLRLYEAWCCERGVQAFPVTPDNVGEYLSDVARTRKVATVKNGTSRQSLTRPVNRDRF